MLKEIGALLRDILSAIRKRKCDLYLVETKPGSKLPKLTPEIMGSVTTLGQHPGFEYLLIKLQLQHDMLLAKLVNERFGKLEEAEFIQSGVFWTGWLEGQLRQAVYKTTTSATRASAEQREQEIFSQLPTIEEVGQGEA